MNVIMKKDLKKPHICDKIKFNTSLYKQCTRHLHLKLGKRNENSFTERLCRTEKGVL